LLAGLACDMAAPSEGARTRAPGGVGMAAGRLVARRAAAAA